MTRAWEDSEVVRREIFGGLGRKRLREWSLGGRTRKIERVASCGKKRDVFFERERSRW